MRHRLQPIGSLSPQRHRERRVNAEKYKLVLCGRSALSASLRLITASVLLAAVALLSACDSVEIQTLLATSTPTLTHTPTQTQTPTQTPTPSPTPQPIARVQEADHQLFNGDWEKAAILYSAALDQQPDPAIAAAARFGLGLARLRAGDLDGAAGGFTLYLQAYPTDPRIPEAYFHLGGIAQAQGTWGVAIQNYQQYLALRPGVIDSYVWERIARCYLEWGDYPNAIAAYEQAILGNRAGGLTPLVEKKAEALRVVGDYDGAVALYDLVAVSTDSHLTLARMDILRGQVELLRGNIEPAYTYFQHAVENYPDTFDAYQSLVALVDAGVPVSELQRGIVNYHTEQYDLALAAFNRYIESTESPDASAYYFAALARRALNQPVGAIANFDVVIDNYPESDLWDDAWTEKAYTQWAWADDYGGAVTTLETFAAAAPAHPAAPPALFQAGRIAERQGDLARAAQVWSSINALYPNSAEAPEGAFFSGIALYRAGNYESAVGQFTAAATHAAASAERRAAAWLWAAKTQRLRGATAESESAFESAIAADPGGYYSLRAVELRDSLLPFPPTRGYDFSFQYDAEKAEAEAWLAATLGVKNTGALGVMSPAVAADGRWVRGRELWALGLTAEAKAEFDELRRAFAGDALSLYQIALALRELGAYSQSIRAARASVDAAGLADSFAAPAFFTHLRFAPYYSDLILKAASDHNIDPLLMYAVVRQESLFEGSVTSSAAAQGLMQIIPSTGEWIAGKLNWPNYTNSDLYRPFINVEFGAYYLDYQRNYLGGDMLAALAAYNAGPGNAERWLAQSQNDPDLFVEIIRLDEPRRYVRAIYEFYEIYRGLYGVGP
ncbi:MAG: tetratricopeptide repeat protein [Chloroflexi bacterium]|nr:tetratricopeptide repeat protein [Chloroflexota bacterium]